MEGIHSHIDEELRIVQPSALRLHFEIRTGDSVVGSLTFQWLFGSVARVESANGWWNFHRTGFLRKRVFVRAEDQDVEIATYVESMLADRGTLRLFDGREFRVRTDFWLRHLEILGADGSRLVRYNRIRGFLHRSATARVLPEAGTLQELPWLVPFGWFIAVVALRDRSARAG